MRQLAGMVHPDLEKYYLYSETVGNIRLGEDDVVSMQNNIVSFKTSQELK
jgi:ribosome-binding ATPase